MNVTATPEVEWRSSTQRTTLFGFWTCYRTIHPSIHIFPVAMSGVQVNDAEGGPFTKLKAGLTVVEALKRIRHHGLLEDKGGFACGDDDIVVPENAPYVFKRLRQIPDHLAEPASASSRSREYPESPQRVSPIFSSNGIDFDRGVVMERSELVAQARTLLEERRFLVIGAPPAYGKTSLLQLLERNYEQQGMWVIRTKSQSADSDSVFAGFLRDTSIDLARRKFIDPSPGHTKVILLDDAHKQFAIANFWDALIKDFPTWPGSNSYKFVFAVTYDLLLGGSPVAFEDPAVSRLYSKDLLLNTTEGPLLYEEYANALAKPNWNAMAELRKCVLCDSGGQIGLVTSSLLFLQGKCRLLKEEPPESALLQMLFSGEYLCDMKRNFDIPSISVPRIKHFLIQVFVGGPGTIQFDPTTPDELSSLRGLVRGGVLSGQERGGGTIGDYEFVSPVGKRTYYEHLFPNRGPYGAKFGSVSEVVLRAIQTFSMTQLQNAAKASAASEHLFMGGLARVLPASAAVSPEMSRSWGKWERIFRNA